MKDPRLFSQERTNPARALQAWQILIATATNRQTVTYELLSKIMYGKPAAGVLNKILGHIAAFCHLRNLPPLTTIVVGKWGGTPGAAIPVLRADIDRQREEVYRCDWFNLYPPSENELDADFRECNS